MNLCWNKIWFKSYTFSRSCATKCFIASLAFRSVNSREFRWPTWLYLVENKDLCLDLGSTKKKQPILSGLLRPSSAIKFPSMTFPPPPSETKLTSFTIWFSSKTFPHSVQINDPFECVSRFELPQEHVLFFIFKYRFY